MKKRLFKIIGISLSALIGILVLGFAVYVVLNYPRKAESFKIVADHPTQKILIATQGSDFKNSLTRILCDSLKKSSVYIRVIDVRDLAEVKEDDWDRILIINSFIIRLNRNVERMISGTRVPEKILLFVTSGGADWLPQSEIKIDALSSASREVYIHNLVHLMTDWLTREDDQLWEPDDVLLALAYFPQVNVKNACDALAKEKKRYQSTYPNLEALINQVGYYKLRVKDQTSALEVFRLNTSLFPDSWNVYDSYAEALLASGDRESAITNYRKAMELNPGSTSSSDKLKKLSKE